ncbi:hypothetical protein EV424DRAFT_1314978 [Suillus variegatus]|nr:hypothetical protein EV424DRAFT_1314978 [Suillus variegatus]
MPGSHVLVVAYAILDFLSYIQLQVHTAESLEALQMALSVFYTNKHVLKKPFIHEHLNCINSLIMSITLFGTANGFNTELSKHLHIYFAKNAYCASNKYNYEEQMIF